MDYGGILFSILKVVFVVVALIMTIFILLQEGKGGGLAALGGTRAAGVEGVTNPIRRATAYLAVIWFVLAIVLGRMAQAPSSDLTKKALSEEPAPAEKEKAEPKAAMPTPPVPAPALPPAVPEKTGKTETGPAVATKDGTPAPAEAPPAIKDAKEKLEVKEGAAEPKAEGKAPDATPADGKAAAGTPGTGEKK